MATFRKRPGPNRKYLLILITMMIFIVVPFFGEMNISYLYVRTRYGWEVEEYSQFYSIVSTAGIIGTRANFLGLDSCAVQVRAF